MSNSLYRKAPETRSSFINGIKNPESRFYWDRFYDFYADLLLNIAYMHGVRQQAAEDVLQETVMDIAKAVQTLDYDRQRGSFRAWICTIMRRRLYDSFRKNAKDRNVCSISKTEGVADEERIPDLRNDLESLIDKEWLLQLRRLALSRLRKLISSKHFAIFEAVEINEWPVEQVVQTFGITRDAVYQIRHRVKPQYSALLVKTSEELDNPA